MPAHQVKLWSDNNFATETLQLRHVENFAALIPQWFRSAQLHSLPLAPAFPSARPRESGDPALGSGFPLARERTEILSSSPHPSNARSSSPHIRRMQAPLREHRFRLALAAARHELIERAEI